MVGCVVQEIPHAARFVRAERNGPDDGGDGQAPLVKQSLERADGSGRLRFPLSCSRAAAQTNMGPVFMLHLRFSSSCARVS